MNKGLLIGSLLAANIATGFAQYAPLNRAVEAMAIGREDAVMGNARYEAMGGAMSAFGGNSSAIKDNPAGLGVYRKWDIAFSPDFHINNDGDLDLKVNNFGFIINFGNSGRTNGYVTSSLGIAYNRLRSFERFDYTTGTLSPNNPKDKSQWYDNEYSEDNGSHSWDFSYGLNISNFAYIGAGLCLSNINYSMTSIFSSSIDNSYTGVDIWGSGVSLKVGAILKPTDAMRISLAFQSPTWYDIERDVYWDEDRPRTDSYDYTTPIKLDAGLGFVIGKKALIGIDYTMQNFSNMSLSYDEGHKSTKVEKEFDEIFKNQHTLRVGTEIQMGKGFAGRLGYAFQTSPTEDLSKKKIEAYNEKIDNGDYKSGEGLYSIIMPKETQYVSAGFGYQGKVFYVDMAYVLKMQKETMYESLLYNTDGDLMKPLNQTSNFHNITATIGFRF